MEEVDLNDAKLVSEAIVVWTGKGISTWPERDEQRLVDEYGSATAKILMPIVRRLHDEFYSTEARFQSMDILEIGEIAAADFRKRHPEISESAVEALAWCYMYDFK